MRSEGVGENDEGEEDGRNYVSVFSTSPSLFNPVNLPQVSDLVDKGEKFIDENVHLISACQLAGYRHVIGTLWEVKDETCVAMARITYEGIRDRGMTDESVAWGLHKAARELRDRRLSVQVTAEPGSKSGREGVTSLGVDEVDANCANDRDQRGVRLPRDIVSCDNDDREVGLWVPYVHFGV